MKDLIVTEATMGPLIESILSELKEHKTIVVTSQPMAQGKWTMTKLWRSWVGSVAEFMASNGVTMPLMIGSKGEFYGKRPFNADDCHELMTSQFLGVDAEGNRLSFSKSGRDGMRAATKYERLYAMQKLEVWAAERGIQLMNPRDSEYRKLIQESEA